MGGNVHGELVLPCGLIDRAKRVRTATLAPITGHGELFGADDPNPFRAALHLLAVSTRELGPYRGAQINPALLGRLLPVDRDYMLLQLNRLSFGDERYQTVECPQPECGRRIDVRFDLSSAEPPEVVDPAGGTIALADGGQVRFRLPLASDQVDLHGLSPAVLEAAFLDRCVLRDRDLVSGAELMKRPAPVRADVVKRILAASPELDLAVPLACLECGRPFRFVFDPVLSLLAELKASRKDLIKQIHRLALSYHWSQSEILGLSRTLRHEYLNLLHAEAGR